MSRYPYCVRQALVMLGAIALSLSLMACETEEVDGPEAQGTSNESIETSQPADPAVSPTPAPEFNWSLFTRDELFDAGSGGCGMTLLPVNAEQDQYLLFNGVESGSMKMKVNGAFVSFEKEDGEGQEFYGQQLKQTFSHAELDLIVETDVVLGEPGEIESVEISGGTVSLVSGNSREEIAVLGDAGC